MKKSKLIECPCGSMIEERFARELDGILYCFRCHRRKSIKKEKDAEKTFLDVTNDQIIIKSEKEVKK